MKLLKRVLVDALLTLIILTLFSCGVYNVKKDNSKNNEIVQVTTTTKANIHENSSKSVNSKVKMSSDFVTEDISGGINTYDRKIAKSVYINAETKTFEDSIEWFKRFVSSYNGIIDNSYIDTGDLNANNYKKNANFSIRIPADNLNNFLSKIVNNLNITFKQESIVDVTDDYYDLDSRLKSLKIEEESLNAILMEVTSVDELIKIEDRLSEVRANIENINRRIKNYDKQINYSKVDISILEVKDLTDVKAYNNDFSKETLNKKLKNTYEEVILFLKNCAAYIFINIPWIILGIIVLIIQILFYIFIKSVFLKKKDDKSEDKDIIIADKNSDKSKKNKDSKKKKSKEDKDELNDEENFNKTMEEIGKAIFSDGEDASDSNSDVDVEFFNDAQ